MNAPQFNLVVLRVSDVDRSAEFYRLLGLTFSKHSHGTGPLHYASESGGCVFELYPSSPQQPSTRSTRIGFVVADLDDAVGRLGSFPGAVIISAPKDTEWGRRAVVADPEGHRIELTAAPRD